MRIISAILILLVFSSCFFNNEARDKKKIALAEIECAQTIKINRLPISLYGYFPDEADSIHVKIKRDAKIVENFIEKIPDQITDSLRHIREYMLNREIMLTDTVFLRINRSTEKKVYNFRYLVRPHFTMLSSGWGCDFYELTVDGKIEEGGDVHITKPGWDIINREDLKVYYTRGR